MEKNTRIFVDTLSEKEYVIIDNGDDSFTSMAKEEYERRQVEHLTEIVADEA